MRALALLLVLVASSALAKSPTVFEHPTERGHFLELWVGPTDCTQLDAGAPAGTHTWCPTCSKTNPCTCGGSGAYAFKREPKQIGPWDCTALNGGTCDSCNICAIEDACPCAAVGGACTSSKDCCEGFCLAGLCTTGLACADIGVTCNICPDINACELTTTTTSSTTTTTTTTLATTTTTTTTTSTTSGSGSTSTTTSTTTTTAGSTTTTLFVTEGFYFTQNLVTTGTDRYGADGNTSNASPNGQAVIMPATGSTTLLSCIADTSPSQADPTCNNTSVPCPIWTVCMMQGNAPYDEAGFADSSQCCTMNSVFNTCADTVHHPAVHEGELVLIHANITGNQPNFLRCSGKVTP